MASLLDRIFRRDTSPADIPAPSTSPPTEPRGGSGRQNVSGFLQYDETNSQLVGKNGLLVFDEMWRTDSDCRRALTLCVNPIVAGTWTVDPYTDDGKNPTAEDEEIARFVHWSLFEQMQPKLPGHLWTALTVAGRMGFGPFEQIYKPATWNGREVFTLKTLSLRRPQSVDRWLDDGADQLLAIEQFVPGSGKWTRASIPAADLVYYRFGAEGDNWEGQSLLRPAYKHWLRKEGLEIIDVMGHERMHIGVPVAYPPQDKSPEAMDAMEDILENLRTNDDTHILMPGPKQEFTGDGTGWHFEIVTPGATQGTGLQDSLKYHTDKIAAVVIAEFMRLGQSGTGAKATADVQQDPFWMLMETLSKIVVEDTINQQLIPRLVDFNYQVDGRYPKLKCSLIDSTSLGELGTYVLQLSQAQVLRPEPQLEDYLRKRADLPEADEAAIAEQEQKDAEAQQQQAQLKHDQAMQSADLAHSHAVEQIQTKANPPAPAAADGKPAQLSLDDDGLIETFRLARQDRPLRGYEQHMSLDRIEGAIDGARARCEQGVGPAVHALARSLAAQAAKGRKVRPAAGPTDVTDAMHGVLADLYTTGRQTVRDELYSQMIDPRSRHPDPAVTLAAGDLPRALTDRAQAAADAIRAAIGAALAAVGLHKGKDPAVLQDAAERAGIAALRNQAMEHAAAALNTGRVDQADDQADEIAGTYYTSILDGSRCQQCARSDDDVLRTLNDPVRLARVPPNRDCQGGGRCRCLESYVLRTEAPASA